MREVPKPADGTLVETVRQRVLRDPRGFQRADLLRLGREPRASPMFEDVVERQQPPQRHLRCRGPAMPDVLDPERPIQGPRRDPAQPEPGPIPRLLDRRLAAPPHETVGQRRIRPADEDEILRAEEHAPVEADQRQPLGWQATV